MENWFTIEQLEADTFAISEYRHWEQTHCYLLVGTRRALLIGVVESSRAIICARSAAMLLRICATSERP